MLKKIEIYILLFFIYSILGWLMEVVGKLIETKKFINRGFLIGPYCPIYGYGAILITLLLNKYINDYVALFIMAMLICSILEYLTSYYMEKIFNARWWDYSRRKFNINGRICLETLIPFGLLGCFIMYISNPFFIKILNEIPSVILAIMCTILLSVFVVDNILSFKIISNVKLTSKKLKDNTEEITEKVRAILKDKSALNRRLMNAFPEMRLRLREKIRKDIYNLKNEKM